MCASSTLLFTICIQLRNPTRIALTPNEANLAHVMNAIHGVTSPAKREGESEDSVTQPRRAKLRTPHPGPLPLRRGEVTKFRAVTSLVLVVVIVLVLVNFGASPALATPLSADMIVSVP